jgi:hypothetical protein
VATIPSPGSWLNGDKFTSTKAHSQIVDPITFLLTPPRVSVTASGANSTTAVSLLISWDGEVYDTDTMHDSGSNPSRIVFQTAGLWLITGVLGVASNTSGNRQIEMRLNSAGSSSGGTSLRTWVYPPASGATTAVPFNLQRLFTATDYIEVFGLQTSGSTLSVNGSMQAVWMGSP